MFTVIDIEDSEMLEALNAQFAANADMFPPDIAIVSRESWALSAAYCDKHRRKLERTLMARARDLAADGWCHAQDRAFRCGLQFHGDGTLWATIRHNGEHVTVLVAVEAESIRDGRDPVLDAAKRAAKAQALLWIAELNAEVCARVARRTFKSSPLIDFEGRKRRAASIPGYLPYAAEYEKWLTQRGDYQRMASIHRWTLESAKVKLEAALHRVQVRAMEGGAE
jgi:hypothetical protein